jgi:hypothetical protein
MANYMEETGRGLIGGAVPAFAFPRQKVRNMSVNTSVLWTGVLNSRRFYRLDRVVQFGLTAESVPSRSNQVTPIFLVLVEAQVSIATVRTEAALVTSRHAVIRVNFLLFLFDCSRT